MRFESRPIATSDRQGRSYAQPSHCTACVHLDPPPNVGQGHECLGAVNLLLRAQGVTDVLPPAVGDMWTKYVRY